MFLPRRRPPASGGRLRRCRSGSSPHVSLLAVSLGGLPYRTLWTTAERVGYAVGSPPSFAAKFLVCILLSPVALVAYPAWVQGKLNGYVHELEAQRRRAAMAGSVKVSVVRVQSDVQW